MKRTLKYALVADQYLITKQYHLHIERMKETEKKRFVAYQFLINDKYDFPIERLIVKPEKAPTETNQINLSE